MAAARVMGMVFRVVVTALRVEGDPWAQIRRSVPVCISLACLLVLIIKDLREGEGPIQA